MIPDLTHLQFAILTIIYFCGYSGKYIRKSLKFSGETPKFYQLMKRMEESGYLISYSSIPGERAYKITDLGQSQWHKSVEFYTKLINESMK